VLGGPRGIDRHRGFAKDFGETKGFGWYERTRTRTARCCRSRSPSSRTPASSVGLATVNMSRTPEKNFLGYWGACSTYGSFSYLKYGMMRLFSQLAQDCPLKVGKVIWVVGHSGPETAEDSRTHFGIFAPGVTQLFPRRPRDQPAPVGAQRGRAALAAALATTCRSSRCT
jgi:transketolase